MAMAIDQTRGGLTFGRFGLGVRGNGIGSVAQQVHDGDTVNVRAIGNFAIRFLGIDTPEVSFTLPGSDRFRSIEDPAWEEFLTDPFAANLTPLNIDPGLRANLEQRLGPGAANNHAVHAEAAHRALERLVQGDIDARGLSEQDARFFAAFTREIVDRYGRLLAFDLPHRTSSGRTLIPGARAARSPTQRYPRSSFVNRPTLPEHSEGLAAP
jgi:hypothetical protein